MPKKVLTGKIVSDKMEKTVVVAVDTVKKHKLYEKRVTSTKRYKVRNETEAKLGDTVKIEETRPVSKEVSWKVLEIIEEK